MSAVLSHHYSPPQARDKSVVAGTAFDTLRREFIDAMATDTHKPLSAPAFARQVNVADVIDDAFCTNPEVLHQALQILSRAAQGGDVAARAWIEAQARSHAEMHFSDLTDELMGERL